ncbi:MAG: glycosyltransferase family 2 protein [Gemmatales bacterium]|nr:glycosyltransferase family 2 protein [Gemmatales bacterium]MDW8387538.1 glycosyltransferase family 2 protein [Gemmatales bacterium]
MTEQRIQEPLRDAPARSEAKSQPAASENLADPAAVWVVIPAYNEASRIGAVLQNLAARRVTVVVVDDGSRDNTAAVALAHEGVWVLRHIVNLGQGAALQTGMDFALQNGAEVIVTFDADGQHDAADVDRLIEPILLGKADVVLGSRFLGKAEGIPWSRRLLLRAAVWFTRWHSGLRVSDTHNGLRAFSRHAASRIRITQNRMAHASEILEQIRANRLSYVEVPVTIRYSAATLAKGQSSWNAIRILGQLLVGKMIR